MKPYKGINYDTGFEPYGPEYSSRKTFDIEVVGKELQIIAENLGCTDVRITGAEPKRIENAARLAISAGMNVWFSPFPCNLQIDNLISYLVSCAISAESIRRISSNTIFVLGCEISLFNNGFLPGNHLLERSQTFTNFGEWKFAMNEKLKQFFETAILEIRKYFKGKITYAAGEWEQIEWSLFDLVSVDLYRAKHNQSYYEQQLKTYLTFNKPLAITEFGCCPVRGASGLGGNATFTILSFQQNELIVNEGWQYDEDEQVNYLKELYSMFQALGVMYTFWFTFADYEKRYNTDKKHNLDMASYGVVQTLNHNGKTFPEMHWEPRKIFWSLNQV